MTTRSTLSVAIILALALSLSACSLFNDGPTVGPTPNPNPGPINVDVSGIWLGTATMVSCESNIPKLSISGDVPCRNNPNGELDFNLHTFSDGTPGGSLSTDRGELGDDKPLRWKSYEIYDATIDGSDNFTFKTSGYEGIHARNWSIECNTKREGTAQVSGLEMNGHFTRHLQCGDGDYITEEWQFAVTKRTE